MHLRRNSYETNRFIKGSRAFNRRGKGINIVANKINFWNNPYALVFAVVFVLSSFFYYVSRDIWVNLEAKVEKVYLEQGVAGNINLKAVNMRPKFGKISNVNTIIVGLEGNEEEIAPGQLVVEFPERFPFGEVAFSNIVAVNNNENNIYRKVTIIPNTTYEERDKRTYAAVLHSDEEEKPPNITRQYDNTINISSYESGIQCEINMGTSNIIRLPEECEVYLKGKSVKLRKLDIKAIKEHAKLKFDGGDITFPEISYLSYSGTLNIVSTFANNATVMFIRNGEPTKFDFGKGQLAVSNKVEGYPLRTQLELESSRGLITISVWGQAGEIQVVGKSLLPTISQVFYANFSVLIIAALTTLFTWFLNRSFQ